MKALTWAIAFLILLATVTAQNIDVQIYAESSSGKDYGNVEVLPADDLDIYINVENTNKDSRLEDIENIEIEVIIPDFLEFSDPDLEDDEQDFEERFSDFDLASKEDKTLSFPLRIPTIIDEKSYQIRVHVNGNEQGSEFSFTENFDMEIVKKSQHVQTTQGFSSSKGSCASTTPFSIELLNLGSEHQDIDLSIRSPQSDFAFTESITLNVYPKEVAYSKLLNVEIPPIQGEYLIESILSYPKSGIIERYESRLKVDCAQQAEKLEQAPVAKQNSEAQNVAKRPVISQPATASSEVVVSSPSPVLFLIVFVLIAGIILLILILLLLRK